MKLRWAPKFLGYPEVVIAGRLFRSASHSFPDPLLLIPCYPSCYAPVNSLFRFAQIAAHVQETPVNTALRDGIGSAVKKIP